MMPSSLKQELSDLAITGASPAFSEVLHVGRPNIGDRDSLLERINDMLDRRWLTNAGKYVREFEEALAQLIGVRHCIAITNGTVALEIAARALDLKGEVIVPSLTFIATAHALQWQEITPVFCDIDPDSFNIDPDRIEELITPRTTGIVGVHLWGRPCNVERLQEIAQRHNLKLMFDSAHALGCSYKGRMIGQFGDAEVLSFHATKFVNSFEGGAITTNSDELAERIRLMKNFGFSGYDRVSYLGTNGKMSEVSAAMGLTSLESIETFIEVNRRNYQVYRSELSGIAGIQLISYAADEHCNYQYIVIQVDAEASGIERDDLIRVLHAENVFARRYFYPGCHNMEPYRSYQPHARLLLPNTETVAARIVVLPTGTAVSPDTIMEICRIIRVAVANADQLKQLLGQKNSSG